MSSNVQAHAHHLTPVQDPATVMERFNTYRDALDLPSETFETAIKLFGTGIRESETIRYNHGFAFLTAASIRLACRVHNTPRTIREITSVEQLDRSKVYSETMNLSNVTGTVSMHIDAYEFLDRLVIQYNIPSETITLAEKHLRRLQREQDGAPPTQAAGALWAALRETGGDTMLKDIAGTLHISKTAVRGTANHAQHGS